MKSLGMKFAVKSNLNLVVYGYELKENQSVDEISHWFKLQRTEKKLNVVMIVFSRFSNFYISSNADIKVFGHNFEITILRLVKEIFKIPIFTIYFEFRTGVKYYCY